MEPTSDTSFALQTESQVALESDIIHEFRNSVLQGDWSLCEQLLVKVPFIQSASQNDYAQVKFLLREQRFLELLEQRKLMKALYVLRNELTPLCQNTDRLHQLSSLMVCSTAEEVLAQAQWDGTEGTSRQQLLVELQSKRKTILFFFGVSCYSFCCYL